jgi:hypothetical protein
MTTFNQRIKQARETAGMALDDVLVAVKTELPTVLQASRSTIGRLETITPETKADPFLVQFLCTLYGVALADVSPVAERALDDYAKVIDLRRDLSADDGNTRPLSSGSGESGWTSRIGLGAYADGVNGSEQEGSAQPSGVLAGCR